MPPTLRDIAQALEAWAPPASAQSYDNVGVQVGDAGRPVERALIALDLTADVIAEAKQRGTALILTHHPLIFRPLKSVTSGSGPSGLAFRLAEKGIALYSIHTNLDAARGGVSFALAEQLGLQDVRFLRPMEETAYKLATFVPRDHLEAVRTALADAGAGHIGDYEACAFATTGTGYFRPTEAASPFTNTRAGELEQADEIKLEVEVARWDLGRVTAALEAAHPYEEVAYDVYPVLQASTRLGMGAIGTLETSVPLADFLGRVAERLEAGSLRYVGDPASDVRQVAVCGGAGSDLIHDALQAGADAYVTADLTYHRFFDVLDKTGRPRMALIDPGHYETERITEKLLQDWLASRFPATEWLRTETRTSPVETFVPPPRAV